MDANVTFRIEESDIQKIDIQCKNDEEMSKIFAKFSQKVLISDISDFEFSQNGNIINPKNTIKELTNNPNAKDIEIKVKTNSKIIKCPECICNNCVLRIKDSKLY